MTDQQPQIPAEMRDLAERSVAQARKAFETFMGAVHRTSGAVDNVAPNGAREVGDKAVSFAESNVNAAFDLAEKLVKAKDIQEVMALQAEYLQRQLQSAQEQARELGETFQKAAGVKK